MEVYVDRKSIEHLSILVLEKMPENIMDSQANQLMNHWMNHPRFLTLTNDQVQMNILWTNYHTLDTYAKAQFSENSNGGKGRRKETTNSKADGLSYSNDELEEQ